MFGPIGTPEIIFIFLLALLIFGPRGLPEVGRTLGKALGEFRKATTELRRSINTEIALEDEHPIARRPTLGAAPAPAPDPAAVAAIRHAQGIEPWKDPAAPAAEGAAPPVAGAAAETAEGEAPPVAGDAAQTAGGGEVVLDESGVPTSPGDPSGGAAAAPSAPPAAEPGEPGSERAPRPADAPEGS